MANETEGIRLQKVLAAAEVGSRRACEALIDDGRVFVNGQPARLGQRVDPERDRIVVDGVRIATSADAVYYLMHKPAKVITTASDPQGRTTVLDLLGDTPRVFPVGRLDYETEGLLLLTNDGDLTHRLTHPSFGVAKEYLAHVSGTPARGALRALREGVELEDGITAPAQASVLSPGVLRLVIHEGRNRQVRRMCEAVGHPVKRLVRTRIGPLSDQGLASGQWRSLTRQEIASLERAVGETPRSAH